MTNLNSHHWLLTVANQSKIRTKYFKLGSYTVLFWPPPWEFDTFSSHLFLPWFYKKWLKRYTLRYIPQISPEKFRPHCVVFDSGSVWRPSPLTAYHLLKKQQRQEALCFVSPPLSGMVRRHYWSENWLHIYQSNLVDFKSRPTPDSSKSSHGLVGVWLTFVSVLFRCCWVTCASSKEVGCNQSGQQSQPDQTYLRHCKCAISFLLTQLLCWSQSCTFLAPRRFTRFVVYALMFYSRRSFSLEYDLIRSRAYLKSLELLLTGLPVQRAFLTL